MKSFMLEIVSAAALGWAVVDWIMRGAPLLP